MRKKKGFKPHFRRHKKNGHPAYIYSAFGNEFKYVGITHAKYTDGKRNRKLKYNPNLKDTRQSYARPFSTHDLKKNFKKKPLLKFRLHIFDRLTIKKSQRKYRR